MLIFLASLFYTFPWILRPIEAPRIQTSTIQSFEDTFTLANAPLEFLPGWTGNEVRSSASRIFQSSQGRNGTKALAAQPIATFNAEITILLDQAELVEAAVQFWAKSVQNGTGTRASEVYYSWAAVGNTNFSIPMILGSDQEFGNEDQEFRKFQLQVPDTLQDQEMIRLKIEIRYGSGSGSAARWIMDDFEFGVFEEDLAAPKIELLRGYDEGALELIFNEPLDPIFSTFSLNYSIDGVEIQKAELKNDSIVYLLSAIPLLKNENYRLSISQIPDLAGNFMRDTLISFTFFDPIDIPQKGIVINEIMPAPKGDLDLPNVEYVELYNASDQDFRLDELAWSNSRNSTAFPSSWIASGEYLILAPENQAPSLAGFGKIIPLKDWPTLLNSGDVLSLSNSDGKVIDRLSYNTSSWQGSEFANGGFSLEVANPFYTCDQSEYLEPSVDPLRGTPGRQNSVFSLAADAEAPRLISGFFKDETNIILIFSKPVSTNLTNENFSFDTRLTITEIVFEESNRIRLALEFPAQPNTTYTMRFLNLFDCTGTLFSAGQDVELILPVLAQSGDLVINELLFNPKTGFPKFVELYNPTANFLEVSSWQLANLNESGLPTQNRKLGEEHLQVAPGGFVVVTTNSAQLLSAFPNADFATFYELSTLPSYPISGGDVVLLDAAGNVMEVFTYSEELHHPLLRDSKGVSLERISSSSPVNNLSNWHSASSIIGYGTPGRRNSQVIPEEFEGNLIQIEPEVFDPEGSNGNTFTSIRYELAQAGWIGNFRIYAISGQLIQSLAQNEVLGTKGLFTWTGTDSAGKVVRPGYYILLAELFDLSGNLKSIKKTVVVATRF